MTGILVFFAFVAAIGVAVLFHYIAKAPEGYQDRSGFRFGPRPESDGKGVGVSGGRSLGASAHRRIAARQSQTSHHRQKDSNEAALFLLAPMLLSGSAIFIGSY